MAKKSIFYTINGNCYTGKSRNIVNASLTEGNSNSNVGNMSISSFLNAQQKVLFDMFNCLDAVKQAKLITFADRLVNEVGELEVGDLL